MDIVVLAGGLSAERDVSLQTGSMVTDALRQNGHRVVLLDVFLGCEEAGADPFDLSACERNADAAGIADAAPDPAQIKAMRKDRSDCFFGPNVIRICQMADIVFLALHGEDGENGKLQAAFDLFGIRYTGSGYLGSALAMNKEISKLFFQKNGIPTPDGIHLTKSDSTSGIETLPLTLPCVVKPCCGGSSIGVSIVHSKESLSHALEEAFRWEDEVIIENYIKGREFSVAVIDRTALPVIEMAPLNGFYDYKNKYKAGSTIETCPADLPDSIAKKMQACAVAAADALGLFAYSRMDFLMDEAGAIFCLEANTLPGMTPTSLIPQEARAIGMDFPALCEKLIEISLKKYGG